jgi:carbamoyltransferase
MNIWGINSKNHDSSLSIIQDNQLIFAAHSERYSGKKNDSELDVKLIKNALDYGHPDLIVLHENHWFKTLRQLFAGQGLHNNNPKTLIKKVLHKTKFITMNHHLSHAAAGYYTSRFDEACVVVIDAIGEFETMSIWQAQGPNLTRKFSLKYPDSIGLWYSAMTDRIDLKANEEEYILMGMAAYGDKDYFEKTIIRDFFEDLETFKLKKNLHRGCRDWMPMLKDNDYFHVAAATQHVYEKIFDIVLTKAKALVPSKNLVLMGGCALNCSANSLAFNHFDDVWIMPNPGDAGSSLGAILANTQQHIDFTDCFLGYNIEPKTNLDDVVDYLFEHKICGLAQGREEFGPRALGNRSLLADPRGKDVKDRVNQIKKRQEFRPFAPIILEEYIKQYFDIIGKPRHHRFMQYTSKCLQPDMFPAIIHKDGTSRVQSVPNDRSRIRQLLEKWFLKTGCPILLNTSLNIKGQPLVHDVSDAEEFERLHKVKVFI